MASGRLAFSLLLYRLSGMIPGWPKKDTEEKVGAYLVAHAGGDDDDTIRAKMGLTHGKFRQLKREALSLERVHLRGQTTEDVYLEYKLSQVRLTGFLERMLPEFKKADQAGPQVAAIKAIADINDRVIKTGQEMGILERASEPGQGTGGNLFADLSTAALRKVITSLAGEYASLEAKYGSKSIIDAEYGEIYPDPPKELPTVGKHNRSSTGRTAGARRRKVVKQKAVG